MCKIIADVDNGLIGVRNKENETPFFLAALNGNKDAFLCLHELTVSGGIENDKTEKGYDYCRRSHDGQTILHVAIEGEYFDLAFQIMYRYDKLGNFIDQQGYSPLHILAKNTSAFRSQMHLGWFQKIIYHCTFVDESTFTKKHHQSTTVKDFDEEKRPNHPENYQTCINFYRVFSKAFKIFVGRNNEQKQADTNSQVFRCNNQNQQADIESQVDPKGQDQHNPKLPANYEICYDLIKFFVKSALIIVGIGSREIRKIQDKREKHLWSIKIMNKLLENSTQYEYLNDGQKPADLSIDEDMFTAGKEEEQPKPEPMDKAEPEKESNSKKKLGCIAGSLYLQAMRADLGSSTDGSQESIFKEIQAMRADLDKIAAQVRRDLELKTETPILLAAKNGIKEMVEKILKTFPRALDDTNTDGKNIVLLAVETRQPHIYELLLDRKVDNESVFRRVDNEGNSALHLAAKLGNYRPWLVSGAALQMQWEYKWYEFVKESMPLHFFNHRNMKGYTPRDIFTETHKDLVKSSGEWLTNTSQSCSVVAALIAGVAFATMSAVPGGLNQDKGQPVFKNQLPFDIFSIAALVALCSSVTALVIFLAILTSRYHEKDFHKVLPRRLIFGLSSIFVSICAMLVSFSAGHFFVLKDSLKYMALPVYAITCFPVTIFAMAQFPLYFDLIKAKFTGLPQRRQKVVA
ncbi:Ankyrin repeat-containing protein [Actinidia chinensis var. chinensis]|uniref:Ankyrin repeat-containing protein n=1 Tax=Actinidia chinensis var. chinensis TaxID=1590841 RepID=A0A2R6QE64_ACTCC|nr:Ankyrin repeat-containing protein [Actinidia chinensis var. chinensis]